jgi:hypothetical protein
VTAVLKYGSLNLLEPSGPVQAFNGIALPLPYIHHDLIHVSANHLYILVETNAKDE